MIPNLAGPPLHPHDPDALAPGTLAVLTLTTGQTLPGLVLEATADALTVADTGTCHRGGKAHKRTLAREHIAHARKARHQPGPAEQARLAAQAAKNPGHGFRYAVATVNHGTRVEQAFPADTDAEAFRAAVRWWDALKAEHPEAVLVQM